MKCLSLFSGGLDSVLAICLMKEQGIDVLALHFDIGFSKDDKSEILRQRANSVGADFELVDIKNKYLQEVLFSPKYGYGKHFNPCIDCHAFMIKTAINMLESKNASFIITGEVLGQRPMSQRLAALKQVSNLSGDSNNLILRPLCAKLLEPTSMEINGIVNREMLYDISGRSRNVQMQLAKKFNLLDFESPAGGCLLTMSNFSNKIKDMLKFEKIETNEDIEILKFGRHLRLRDGAKMVIGRDEVDNERLNNIKNDKFVKIEFLDEIIGAHSFLSKNATKDDKTLAARLALTYAKTQIDKEYKVIIQNEQFLAKAFHSKDCAQEFFIK